MVHAEKEGLYWQRVVKFVMLFWILCSLFHTTMNNFKNSFKSSAVTNFLYEQIFDSKYNSTVFNILFKTCPCKFCACYIIIIFNYIIIFLEVETCKLFLHHKSDMSTIIFINMLWNSAIFLWISSLVFKKVDKTKVVNILYSFHI